MKTPLPFVLSVVAVFILPTDVLAKGKGKGRPAAPAAPAEPAQPNAASPAEALAPYMNNLDALLALRRTGNKPGETLIAQAPGRLVVLREEFVSEKGKAPEGERAKFDAAVATCDALSAALDERAKVVGDLTASSAVQGSSKIEAGARKDNLTQGIDGNGKAKAVGTMVERRREVAAERAAKARTAAGDNAMTAMAENRWNQRSIELRKKIAVAYAGVK